MGDTTEIAEHRASALPMSETLAPDTFERAMSVTALALLAATVTAVLRGQREWAEVPWQVWPHLTTITVALVLTPIMLLRRRGDRLHRQLGWLWAGAMVLTALSSFEVRLINRGGFSFIHLLSIWTLIQVPVIILAARRHDTARHRSAVRGMVFGALLLAGFFTFPFDRLLGRWLFG